MMFLSRKGKVGKKKKRTKQRFFPDSFLGYLLRLQKSRSFSNSKKCLCVFFMTGKRSKITCRSASHKLFKDKAKNRVDDLQGMLLDLQFARKESRGVDVTLLEEQVNQMLREWKSELNEPSPASSLQQEHGGTLGSFSTDICRLLQLCDEEDDATSKLAPPKPEPTTDQTLESGKTAVFQREKPEHAFPLADGNNFDGNTHLDYNQYEFESTNFNTNGGFNDCPTYGPLPISAFIPTICPPPSAFLGPKCALWDCPRPAQGYDWFQDYCSSFHAALAFNEGPPGMNPVVRPGGIGLKDGLLFAALSAKAGGKDVGIPECEGAATAKSPWNAPELFDLTVLESETLREWLFFDKPRRAFESGNRKQRSLPDYNGRGWHESRKQIMSEFGGLKRSYYMDPQPLHHFEWHLYEYEINKCDACALYRLELKLVVDGKKNSKGKVSTDSVADLQKQMGRLTAEFPPQENVNNKRCIKGRPKVNTKVAASGTTGNVQNTVVDQGNEYGVGEEFNYLVGNLTDYYLP
ncbi:Transcription factor VOZ1 [Hirschfeldia incana]|nr:Transcription factor VOZ1 [Hirschfeldia incana]